MTDIPEGFAPFKNAMGFLQANGPIYGKWDGTHLHLGFRVEMRHCNAGKICHGGMLATFADMCLAMGAHFQTGNETGFMPTVNLTCDYLAPAALGVWVEGRADVLRMTKSLVFMQGLATADGAPALRANGIFKITSMSRARPLVLDSLFDQKK